MVEFCMYVELMKRELPTYLKKYSRKFWKPCSNLLCARYCDESIVNEVLWDIMSNFQMISCIQEDVYRLATLQQRRSDQYYMPVLVEMTPGCCVYRFFFVLFFEKLYLLHLSLSFKNLLLILTLRNFFSTSCPGITYHQVLRSFMYCSFSCYFKQSVTHSYINYTVLGH